MPEIPDGSNFYGCLHTAMPLWQVAELFRTAGWVVGQPDDWDHWVASCPWAELVIESQAPVLVHGPVADVETNAERVLAVLEPAGVALTAECYGPGGELLREWRGGRAEPGAAADRGPTGGFPGSAPPGRGR